MQISRSEINEYLKNFKDILEYKESIEYRENLEILIHDSTDKDRSKLIYEACDLPPLAVPLN
jgi:hypothetical protein